MGLVLGIETSCDETAAAVVDHTGGVRANIIASQLDIHQRYGGVVPELASREHLRSIVPVVRAAMEEAGVGYPQLAAVAVTAGPGLMGALLVGVTYAKGIAYAAGIPLIGVNHLEGHIHAVLLEAHQEHQEIEFPALALIVSGGHTHLFFAEAPEHYRLLGRTRDDAVGEAYDKVAVSLGFGYPGGPVLDRIASTTTPVRGMFSVPSMKGNSLDFSFSGFKTAVRRWREAQSNMTAEIEKRRALLGQSSEPALDDWLALTPEATRTMISSFQQTVVDHLETNCRSALQETGARSLIVSGGVASNRGLRERLLRPAFPIPCYFPTPALSTDNAVMIASAAFPRLRRGEYSSMSLSPEAGMRLDSVRESPA
ncbi:MAG: tRNA (adenosine(37)-N6)-threonylcarbamoyltransferase complex transferase subunit TsaD [Bryobacterales bacterium]|nr:tRNA (adenosine(37)-N6)-threonylcarbamoyltransferase complex transferase subunit TsaD [Bryobacterales bacterium]